MARIDRTGTVSFHDASLHVWEEGESPKGQHCGLAPEWERQFKRDVFARIVQTLNRLGWTVAPWDKTEQYKCIGLNHRTCHKGDLHGELAVGGRHIEFKMWQDVTPSVNRHGGRYDFDKELRMPYVLRLEMERTRRRIRDYLCALFTGYTFTPPEIDSPNPDPLTWFNEHWDGAHERKRGTHRFERGADGWPSTRELGERARMDGDGALMTHGDVRWMRDPKGRLLRGRVYGGINEMWTFVYGPGRRDYTHQHANQFFSLQPGEPVVRKVADTELRRKRLEQEMQKAVAAMRFERAAVLRNLLFPSGPVYAIYSKKDDLYFASMYRGYRRSLSDAGRYTREELRPYLGDKLETEGLKAVEVAA